MSTGINLNIDIVESVDATKLWIHDITNYYPVTQNQSSGIISKDQISSITVTFLAINPLTNELSDFITTDIKLTINTLFTTNQDIWIEIDVNDLNLGWTTFNEGYYAIKYSINTNSANQLPDNNDSYYYDEVLFAQTQYYRDLLYLNLATQNVPILTPFGLNNNVIGSFNCDNTQYNFNPNYYYNDTSNDAYTQYVLNFDAKLNAFKAVINLGNYTEIRNNLMYLQQLQTKYPITNDDRFIQ